MKTGLAEESTRGLREANQARGPHAIQNVHLASKLTAASQTFQL